LDGWCLIIDFPKVFGDEDTLAPQAVSMLGELRRLQKRLETLPRGPRLTLALTDFGGGARARRLFDDLVSATGDPARFAEAAGPPPSARDLCADASANAILLTKPPVPQLPGATIWKVGDPEQGIAELSDVARRLSERMRLPVPRPVDPARRKGSLVAIGNATTPVLLCAAYADPAADWVALGNTSLVYCEDEDVAASLVAIHGARRIATDVSKARLHVSAEPRPDSLFTEGGRALQLLAEDEMPPGQAQPWASLRRPTSGVA
jgi:hypothetical protein